MSYQPDQYFPKVTSVIASSLPQDTKNVEVYAIAYDASGAIIGGGFTFLDFVPASGQAAAEISVVTTGTPVKVEVYPTPTALSQ